MPRLPLSLGEVRELGGAIRRPLEQEKGQRRLIERFAVRLIEALDREEEPAADPGGQATKRARRLGAALGFGGLTTMALLELAELIEEARHANDIARHRDPGRNVEDRAADLLFLWEAVPSWDEARQAVAGKGKPISERLHERLKERYRWNGSKLRSGFRILRDARSQLASRRGLRAVPFIGAPLSSLQQGREMRQWAKRVERFYESPPQ